MQKLKFAKDPVADAIDDLVKIPEPDQEEDNDSWLFEENIHIGGPRHNWSTKLSDEIPF